jgi:hypothetical protein
LLWYIYIVVILIVNFLVATKTITSLFYAFFWVIPRGLNFICRRFGTLCSIFIGRWVWNSDAGELPWRNHKSFRTRRVFEINNFFFWLVITDTAHDDVTMKITDVNLMMKLNYVYSRPAIHYSTLPHSFQPLQYSESFWEENWGASLLKQNSLSLCDNVIGCR